MRGPWLSRLRPVAANAVVIGAILLVYRMFPFVGLNESGGTLWTLLASVACVYIAGYAAYALVWRVGRSKGELVLSLMWKFATGKRSEITSEEKLALLTTLLKAYFIPVMTGFFIKNGLELRAHVLALEHVTNWRALISLSAFNMVWYPLLFALFLFVDVMYFTFGYFVDHATFGNVIKSVDGTLFGWVVTLACYPPFNDATGAFLGWYASDVGNAYTSAVGLFVFSVLSLFLFGVYVWATLALGTKCSNLTNRGIVAKGPYAYVRHPAYATKNAAWIVSVLPLMNPIAYASVAAWAGIYYLRAVTEERHLSHDPDYLAYKKQVRWRFVPGIW